MLSGESIKQADINREADIKEQRRGGYEWRGVPEGRLLMDLHSKPTYFLCVQSCLLEVGT